MIRIHVIYCGGCREAYDRGEWLGGLKRLLSDRIQDDIDLCYSPCPDARIQLFMFGCAATCLNPDAERIPGLLQHSIGPGGWFDGRFLPFEEIADQLGKDINSSS